MDTDLGRLERLDLREAWQREDGDFTTWLAESENLALLGETIGLELELEGTEQTVGPFRADILCKDTSANAWVLVENQLEKTDHVHLGQLLTYAAGLEAVTIVWIARRFTDEHRAALDWLNEITDDRFNFFGLEIELWRIGNSPPAPKLNVISKPNYWSRSVGGTARGLATESGQPYLEYWAAFQSYMQEHPGPVNPKSPAPRYWLDFSVGRGGFLIRCWASRRDGRMGLHLAITDRDFAKSFFTQLQSSRAQIETELGETLEWRLLPENRESQIALVKQAVDPTNEGEWAAQHEWLAGRLYAFYRSFSGRVQRLKEEPMAPEHEGETGPDITMAAAPDAAAECV